MANLRYLYNRLAELSIRSMVIFYDMKLMIFLMQPFSKRQAEEKKPEIIRTKHKLYHL